MYISYQTKLILAGVLSSKETRSALINVYEEGDENEINLRPNTTQVAHKVRKWLNFLLCYFWPKRLNVSRVGRD